MKFTTFIAAFLATAVIGAPTERGTKEGFTIAQNEVSRANPKIAALAYHKSLYKFGAKISDNLHQVKESYVSQKLAGGSGSTGTQPTVSDKEYLTPVNIGGSTLNLDIDTGSADLWVFSDELSPTYTNGHDIYQTKKSGFSGALMQGSTWSITYGDSSSASGNVYSDAVTLAGITAPKQAVEAASRISELLAADTANDGIFGFAFSTLNTVQPQAQNTWFDNVKGQLSQPIFAAALKHNAPGFYDFGYLNSSRYTGNIAYTRVNPSKGFWQIGADGYAVGNQQYSEGPGSFTALVDTGTSLVLGSPDLLMAYYNQIATAYYSQAVGGVIFNCAEKLHDLSLIINGQMRTAPGSLFNYTTVGEQVPGYCFGGIQDNGGLGFAVIGDTFLKSQYVVFDAGVPQVGFAQATA